MYNRIKQFVGQIVAVIVQPEFRILPGQIAFFLVMSLVPIITIVGIILTFLSFDSLSLVNSLTDIGPSEVSDFFGDALTGKTLDVNMVVFLAVSFILASNGTTSIINASDSIYKLESGGYLRRKFKGLILAFILVFLIVFILLVPVFGDKIIEIITSVNLIQFMSDEIYIVYQILKWPISLVVVYFSIKLIYMMAPSKRIKGKEVSYGAALVTIFWFLATFVFAYYAENLASYDVYYGGLSAFIVLLMWIYIISYIFVIGMAINAKTYKKNIDQQLERISTVKKQIADKVTLNTIKRKSSKD